MRHVLSKLLLPLLFCLPTWQSNATTISVPPFDDVVQASDVGIVGTLHNVSHWTNGNLVWAEGDFLVESVLFGETTAGARLHMKWVFDPDRWIGVDLDADIGRSRTWLLDWADAPRTQVITDKIQCFKVYSALDIKQSAAKRPFRGRGFRNGTDKPVTVIPVELQFRNETTQPLTVPEITVVNGKPVLPPSGQLRLYKWYLQEEYPTEQPLTSGSVLADNAATTSLLTLAPGARYSVTFDLNKLYPCAADEHYTLFCEIPGLYYSGPFGISTYPDLPLTEESLGREAKPRLRFLRTLFKYPPGSIALPIGLALIAITLGSWIIRKQTKRNTPEQSSPTGNT
jgi:hypothetical protein